MMYAMYLGGRGGGGKWGGYHAHPSSSSLAVCAVTQATCLGSRPSACHSPALAVLVLGLTLILLNRALVDLHKGKSGERVRINITQ